MRGERVRLVLAAALGVAIAASAEARELHWKSLAVTARLDAEGVLHVRERQHLVMTGDWNGGERLFRIEPAQELQLQGMRRIDPATGAAREMTEGDLDEIDHYGWTSGNVLRWRSRLPTHREFDHTDLVYELDYTFYGALQPYGDAYLMAHDFAFAERPGAIESLVVDLAIDPAWNVDGGHERRLEAGPLPVGTGYTVRLGLRPTAGASVATLSPERQRLVLVLLLVPALLLLTLFAGEWIRGRLAPLDPGRAGREIDRELLGHPAEVVGAVWDRAVGADEVGALIARLAAEGKIKTTVLKGGELQMTLLVDRKRFDGYERELIDAFFYGDRTTTNTSQVRKRYEKTGFDPAAKIRAGVEEKVEALTGPPARRLPVWLPTVLALAGGAYVGLTAPGPFESRVIGLVVLLLPAAVIGGIGVAVAAGWRSRIDRGLLATLRFVVWIAILVGLAAEVVMGFRHLPMLAGATGGGLPQRQWAAVLFALAMVNSIVNSARSRERMQGIALRKRLASARRFFQDEFRKPEPALRDEWFPYVLALGLDGDSRRWFRSFGGESADRSSSSGWTRSSGSSAGGSSSGSNGPAGWTGGGGAFGGAGATASWSAAAGALSAGVAAPSSSSSGSGSSGGGGGGGSSSGGGGGGGW